LRELAQSSQVVDPCPEIEALIELETELDMGLAISRDEISERQFRALILLRRLRDEAREVQAKQEAARAALSKIKPLPLPG
jgi:hypothetical protein